MLGSSHRLIAAKLRPPPLAAAVIRRQRLEDALSVVAHGRRVVLVVAGAGAGKTTAAAHFLATRPAPAAWLSLDAADRVAGRFVSYLAASLGEVEPRLRGMVRDLLADGLLPEDCAGLLADQAGPGWTIVLDDLHHLEPDAPALGPLHAFLRYLPAGSLAVLVSRRMPSVGLSQELLTDQLCGIFDRELAFRVDETRALLDARQLGGDPEAVQEATGGWAAGIVFEALRDADAPMVLPPGEDPLFAYLGGEVLDRLPADLRRSMLRSAVLDYITAERLGTVLGEPQAHAVFAELTRLHLPAAVEPGVLRYHPQLREFLEHKLHEELPAEVSELLESYARQLASEGFLEEAVDTLLRAGRADLAEPLAERAVVTLRRRGDWSKLLGWAEALGDEAHRRRPRLREAQVRALLNSRRQQEAEFLVHELLATGEIGELAEHAPDVAAWAVWTLHGSGEWAKLLPLLPPRGRSAVAEAMRYLLVSCVARDAPEELSRAALERMHPLHVVLETALYYQGRLAAAERLASVAAAAGGPVTAAVAQIHKVNVLRVQGQLAAARRVLESAPASIRTSRFVEFWLHAEAELCLEEGRGEHGLGLIRQARAVSRRHGWRVGDGAIFGAVEGRMLVRMGDYDGAVEVLEPVRAWCAERGLASFREWAEAWLGGAYLLLGRPPEQALTPLRQAVAGMRRATRHLELPAAAVFLAEAEWRAGDEEAHDAAAETAYAAAVHCGTLRPLAQALELVPDVLARRIDSEDPAADPRWRLLVVADGPVTGPVAEDARLRVCTFGEPALELDGEALPAVPPKAVELAAHLARSGPPGVARATLASDLFEGSRDGANYLRQVVYRLRRALPAGLTLHSAGGRLAWQPAEAVAADDAVFESLLARARLEVGGERARTLASALDLADRGPYLEGLEDEGTITRRRALQALAMEARIEYAREMRVAGSPGDALVAARAVIEHDSYREDAWQELMRAHAVLHGPGAVLPIFRECERALEEIQVEPSRETRRLLERLRG